MEEEVGVKVTRLRRRLSIEAEDVKSPSTQSTPTKKRGGRLAAKPQLELIDENATETEKPKRTRKSTARDTETEERAVTPSRRSTRIRSNTSIVSETPVETEDKGTPSRRSTRIKSNTSIVSETTQHVDSPRAKRAARRTSQIGSDNETPITPGRSTRRIKKDSTSSIDKQAEPNPEKLDTQAIAVIIEEVGNNKNSPSKDSSAKDGNDSSTIRKSPRLIEKTSKRSSLDHRNKFEEETVNKSNDETPNSTDAPTVPFTKTPKKGKDHKNSNLSVSSSNLIEQLDSEPKKESAHLNKTTSVIEQAQSKLKRRRTKSWTTITLNSSSDNNFLSDTEAIREKSKIKNNKTNDSGSGESVLNTTKRNINKSQEKYDTMNVSLNSPSISNKKNKERNDNSILQDETKDPIVYNVTKLDKSITDSALQQEDPNFTEKFFREAPSGAIQSLVYIEDSDSNTGNAEKENVLQEGENEDQCVPVVEHQLENHLAKEVDNNHSYEPMDIDETIPENVSMSVLADKNSSAIKDTGLQKQKAESDDNFNIENNNKSCRKSTISDLDISNEIVPNKSKKKGLAATDIPTTKSQRKSMVGIEVDDKPKGNSNKPEGDTNSMNKSKRKSSISVFDTNDDKSNESLGLSCPKDIMNKSATKIKRKSALIDNSISEDSANYQARNRYSSSEVNDVHKNDDLIIDKYDRINKSSNRSERNSINDSAKKNSKSNRPNTDNNVDDNIIEERYIDSKSNSSALEITNVNVSDSINKSDTNNKSKNITNELSHKTKKNALVPAADHNKSTRKSSGKQSDEVDNVLNNSYNYGEIRNQSSDKSNRKSSNISEDNINNSFSKSEKESSVSDSFDCGMDKSSRRSKMKSSFSKTEVEDAVDSVLNKSSNKSKRKSSISDMESQIFEKSNAEYKSTLVLSQIKDVSETSAPKDICELNEPKDPNEQLSKSVNMPNVKKDKESNKKNLSLTYSTSTPLQQKPLKQIGMQMNSSIITPNNMTKIENNSSLGRPKKKISNLSQNDASDPSDDEDEDSSEEENEESSEEESIVKSNMIENEADEASDDYESGDSKDEDAREYEEQHEIIEKGETLDSEDEEFSDDSEYEKGSFVVDSDEEDAELLSGSGDDLSMSADELNMSAKSKRKFNDRKIKEQKRASREMFEARHNLNKSDKRANPNKKVNRQRLDSSDTESEENAPTRLKKNKRARIDSSQEITMTQSDYDITELKQKKKSSRRLPDSVSEENVANEQEIFIDHKGTANKDPLALDNIVKKEPTTPKQDLNISTETITNLEVEEVNIENNVTITKSNQTTDPLQTTITENEAVDDDSVESLSENEEITQNYESILSELNKKSNKVKSLDASLNLNKKTKQKHKEPIIDELNLTQAKKLKKRKQNSALDSNLKNLEKDKSSNNKILEKSINIQEEGSSDSIDMKLLFNDDSTDSEVKVSTQKPKIAIIEEFIPLRRTEGKTNILEKSNSASEEMDKSVLNVSKSKKDKRKSPQHKKTIEDEQNVNFYIDTTGTYTDLNKSKDTSIKSSAKKNKQKNSLSVTNVENVKSGDDSNDAPLEVSFQKDKNKRKSKNDVDTSYGEKISVTGNSETPASAKKNKKHSNSSQILEHTETEHHSDYIGNVSKENTKKQQQETATECSVVDKETGIEEVEAIAAEKHASKKRKRKSSANQTIEETTGLEHTKTVDRSISLNESIVPINQKKKRKVSHNMDSENVEVAIAVSENQEEEELSGCNPKKKNRSTVEQEPENADDSTKKSKKRKERDDDLGGKLSKVIKQNSLDKVHVPRLPSNVLKQLDEFPKKYDPKDKIISTTAFKIEETKKRRNKPSNYLEQSVYLNDSTEERTKNKTVKAPKVLPFIPTASTSNYGFTTNFKVNVIPQETHFIAKSSDISNFKKDVLQKNRIKKLGTFEKYKRHRTLKISKF